MTAFTRKKLAEAKFFLDKLQELSNNSDHFYYNISAFLSAWRSTLDIMLYDFAMMFPLGFTREDDLKMRDFKVAARAAQHTEAVRFIDWWENKQSSLGSTPLWKKRNINVHRGPIGLSSQQVQQFTVLVTGSGGTSGTINVNISKYAFTPTSNLTTVGAISPISTNYITSEYVSTSTNNWTNPNVAVSNIWYFDDLPNDDAVNVCRQAYEQIEDIVEEAEDQFHVNL